MQDQCPRKVTHSNNTRTAMSPGGSHRQLLRSVRTHQYSVHVRTAPFTRTRIFFKPHFFYTNRPSFHTKLANPLTGNGIFLKPLHTVVSSRIQRICKFVQPMVTGYHRILNESPKNVFSAILYLCGQCLKLERLKSRRSSSWWRCGSITTAVRFEWSVLQSAPDSNYCK